MKTQMNNLTSFNFYHNSKANTLDVILHGGSAGIESSFMQKIFQKSKEKGISKGLLDKRYLFPNKSSLSEL